MLRSSRPVTPAPGFGAATLKDGPCLLFLAEAEGVRDAREIGTLDGWRAYLQTF
ncbi:MAG TPA: hypothetical protein VGC15_24530 [Acetobacteraceae bacterium]